MRTRVLGSSLMALRSTPEIVQLLRAATPPCEDSMLTFVHAELAAATHSKQASIRRRVFMLARAARAPALSLFALPLHARPSTNARRQSARRRQREGPYRVGLRRWLPEPVPR